MQPFELNSQVDTRTLPQADTLVVGMGTSGIIFILQDEQHNTISSITIPYEEFQKLVTKIFGSGNLQ